MEDELDALLDELCEEIMARDSGEHSEYGGGIASGLSKAVEIIGDFEPRFRALLAASAIEAGTGETPESGSITK